jgi:hypothetical protein
MSDIGDIATVIRDLHGSEPVHVETVPVKETFKGQTVWEGDVEVFDLENHPQAKRVYAWSHIAGENDEQKRYVTVLHIPPVDSPQTAVKLAIVQEYRERERNEEN